MLARPLLLALVILGTAIAGCVVDEGTDPPPPTTLPVEEPRLAILDTPRSAFNKIICDDGGCIRRMTTLETGPANEVMVAQDYANPNVLIAGSKDYHADDPTCVVVSVYSSVDGGRTWADGYPRPAVGALGGPDMSRCESDPAVAFDGRGNALLMTLDTGIGLFTYRSGDNGTTWKEVAMAFEGRNDKNWAASDYALHRVYSITRATCDGGEAITYTDDAGDTWEGPFCFASGEMDFAQVDVGPDGTVYAIGRGDGGIVFAKSPDGQNWSKTSKIADAASLSTLAGEHPYRTPALPDMAVSIATGWIYAVWHDTQTAGDQDVFFTYSFDQGETWMKPVRVGAPGGVVPSDQFIPAVAASPEGDAHVIWFDSRNDPGGTGNSLDVYYAHAALGNGSSESGAVTFDQPIRLTPTSFVPYLARHQQQPFFIGDYIGLTASNNEAVAVFPVTYNGRSEIHAVIVGGP